MQHRFSKMQNATVSATVAGHGLAAAHRSGAMIFVVREDLRHGARDSKPFRQACSASLVEHARAAKDVLRKRAGLKLHAGAAQELRVNALQIADDEQAAKAARVVRAWAAATRYAVQAEKVAAMAAEAATRAKVVKAQASSLEHRLRCYDAGSGGFHNPLPYAQSGPADVLDAYVCPITADIMTDPVCTSDGFTYERRAIVEWLRTKNTSPSTGAKLESKKLIPNITVRCLLQHFSQQRQAHEESRAHMQLTGWEI